jgi:lipooligosaccharide transport system ATP-binding protein
MLQIPTDSASGVAKVLLNRCRVTRIVTRMATLEDVFLKLTGRTMRE